MEGKGEDSDIRIGLMGLSTSCVNPGRNAKMGQKIVSLLRSKSFARSSIRAKGKGKENGVVGDGIRGGLIDYERCFPRSSC